jgi:hypothetical protein
MIFWKCKRKQKFAPSVGLPCYSQPGPVGNRPTRPKPLARARHSTLVVTAHSVPVVARHSTVTQRPRCGSFSGGSTREGKGTHRARGGGRGAHRVSGRWGSVGACSAWRCLAASTWLRWSAATETLPCIFQVWRGMRGVDQPTTRG